MMKEFEEGKTYTFSAEKCREWIKNSIRRNKINYKLEDCEVWIVECDGKEVTVVDDRGSIGNYSISALWCDEVVDSE